MNGYDDRFTDGYIVGSSNGNNNGFLGGGWEGIIGLIVVAGLFGGNWGGGLFGNRGGSPATQADLASGFNNQAVLSNLNDIILGQAQMQNFINQGFAPNSYKRFRWCKQCNLHSWIPKPSRFQRS